MCERRPLWFSSHVAPCFYSLIMSLFFVFFCNAIVCFGGVFSITEQPRNWENGENNGTICSVSFFFPLTLSSKCKMYEQGGRGTQNCAKFLTLSLFAPCKLKFFFISALILLIITTSCNHEWPVAVCLLSRHFLYKQLMVKKSRCRSA